MELLRNCLDDRLGWRVVDAQDTLPPNLRRLQVTDCTSATPLLALTQLTELKIAEHCNMPAAELKRLSSLTQLEHVHLRYQVCRRDVGEEAAQEGSAGWVCVPALKSLQLHMARIDPACDLLQHLAACTSLTRLVWEDSRFLTLGDLALRLELADDEFPEEFMTYGDGGLGALGAALPASLKEVEFEDFLPQPDGGTGESDEGAIVLGLYYLRCAIDALPHLEYHRLRDDTVVVDMYSEAGVKLINMLMYVEGDFNEPEQAEAFFSAHAEAYPHHFSSSDADDGPDGDGCDDEGSSEAEGGSREAEGGAEAD